MIDRRCFLGMLLLSGGAVLSSCSNAAGKDSEVIPLFAERKDGDEAASDGAADEV